MIFESVYWRKQDQTCFFTLESGSGRGEEALYLLLGGMEVFKRFLWKKHKTLTQFGLFPDENYFLSVAKWLFIIFACDLFIGVNMVQSIRNFGMQGSADTALI